MPRKNKPKKLNTQHHYATPFSPNYKEKCYGCAFVGPNFECLTSDGVCLKSKPPDDGGSTVSGGGMFRT